VKKYFQQIGGDYPGEIVHETSLEIVERIRVVVSDQYGGSVRRYEHDDDAIRWCEIEAPAGRCVYGIHSRYAVSVLAVDWAADPSAAVLRWGDGEWTPTGATTADLGICG